MGANVEMVPRGGIEPPTLRFSVACLVPTLVAIGHEPAMLVESYLSLNRSQIARVGRSSDLGGNALLGRAQAMRQERGDLAKMSPQ